jgi:aquaporin Z
MRSRITSTVSPSRGLDVDGPVTSPSPLTFLASSHGNGRPRTHRQFRDRCFDGRCDASNDGALVSNGVGGPDEAASVSKGPQSAKRQQQLPQPGWHGLDWACEFIGTMVLVFVGLSAVVLNFETNSPVAPAIPSRSARLLLTGVIFAGSGALVAISPIGRRSGAHLNPSITLAFWCRRHLRLGDLAGYVVSQLTGALAATLILQAVWGQGATSVRFGLTLPGRGIRPWQAAGSEALMSTVLVVTIFGFVSSARTARWTPLGVWVIIAIFVWQVAPYTGTSLNPARSLGPAVVDHHLGEYWIYVAGPLGGALLAAALWRLVPRATLTAKLFHDARYRSVLGSALPVKS